MYQLRNYEQFEVHYGELKNYTATKSNLWKNIYEWLDSIIFALIAIFILFTFFFRIVGVSGPSMKPTLQNKDWLAVSGITTDVKRGDIVVVTQPNKLNEPLIKRVIAVGGDIVDINFADGTVSINGISIDEPYIAEPTNRSFDIAFPVTVPDGCIFVMGDNRNDSLDSRSSIVGFIDKRFVLGKAEFRFYPFGEWKIDSNGK